MTLKLCGFSASNYYNKLKLQLLEKGLAFEEELVWTGNTHPKLVDRSPMGKVPFLETPHAQQFATNHNVQKVMADRKANSEIMIALRSGKK